MGMDRIYRDPGRVSADGEGVGAPLGGGAEQGADPDAVPGVAPPPDAAPAYTLEVAGQVFALRPDGAGGMHYEWLTGPHPGYGFGLSPATGLTIEQHVDHISDFLATVDPVTGLLDDGD